jgi:hypothetical protein
MSNIKKFIKLIEDEKFEEAHEALEEDWLKFKKQGLKERALFLKGLINGATSIALIIRKRSQRAKTITWDAFLKYKDLVEIEEESQKSIFFEAINILETKHKKYS